MINLVAKLRRYLFIDLRKLKVLERSLENFCRHSYASYVKEHVYPLWVAGVLAISHTPHYANRSSPKTAI